MDRVIVTAPAGDTPMARLRNYLRLCRRRSALTQEELAFLLGYRSESVVSRLERHERRIMLAIAFAYQIIFAAEPSSLFPALYEQVEERVVGRMHELYERLSKSEPTKKTAAKLQLLAKALARVANGTTQQEV